MDGRLTDSRAALRDLLDRCPECKRVFDDNVALLVASDYAALTDEQVAAVLDQLQLQHFGHTGVL